MFWRCSEIITKLKPTEVTPEEREGDEEVEPGQGHVFTFYEALPEEEQRELDMDFDSLDMDQLDEAWRSAVNLAETAHAGSLSGERPKGVLAIEPPRHMAWDLKKAPVVVPGANMTYIGSVSRLKTQVWWDVGLGLLSKGRLAIVVLCGGMDARLGENVPKGVLDIGLLSRKSIFQLYAERIRRLQHLAQRKFNHATYVPLYMMCNEENRNTIDLFFRQNAFFGLREQDVMLFTQAYMPILTKQGKLILTKKHKILQHPCGNGGMFHALAESGMIADMKSRGITSMYVCSIDNVLAKVGDPTFLGYCDILRAEVGVKCAEKRSPEDKFGIFCSKRQKFKEDLDGDGKLDDSSRLKAAVLEFWEVSEEQRKMKEKGNNHALLFNAGNMSQYFFRIDFCMRVRPQMKVWHLIPKSMPYVDLVTGEIVQPPPSEKNCCRLEMFIFDAFQHSHRVVSLQVPQDEWAQVKNASGPDSPQTALQAVGRLHQRWIINGGGEFLENKVASDRDDARCEISPLVSYEGEDVSGQFLNVVELPFYLPSQQELREYSGVPQRHVRTSIHYLDLDSHVLLRDMEVEGRLGNAMSPIQDEGASAYSGERAAVQDALPPTPRNVDEVAQWDERSSGRESSVNEAEGRSGRASARKSVRMSFSPGQASLQLLDDAVGHHHDRHGERNHLHDIARKQNVVKRSDYWKPVG